MGVFTRKLRIALSTAATLATMPAAIMASAGVAHATSVGLDVGFQPGIGGITVSVTDTVGAGSQKCTYDAHTEGDSPLMPATHREFVLPASGTVSLQLPGVPTGTLWRVHIECRFSPPRDAHPGLFDDTHEY